MKNFINNLDLLLVCKTCHKYFMKDKIYYKNSSGDVYCTKKCAIEDLQKIDINKKFIDWMEEE